MQTQVNGLTITLSVASEEISMRVEPEDWAWKLGIAKQYWTVRLDAQG
jgi:hypothetical protein